jgi:hypothetical protein
MMSIKVYTKYKLPLLVFSIISALTFSPSLSAVQLSAISPYDSGYNHGCDDAGISDSSDYYINQPKKGPAYHTDEFMDGYYAGFDSCSGSSNISLVNPSGGEQVSCYDRGFIDGEDYPFNQVTYDRCGDDYYHGFLQGCMSVEGNDRDICESATDASNSNDGGNSPQHSTSSNSQRDCSLNETIGGGIGMLAGEMVAPGIGGIITAPIGSSMGKNMCENQ